ncbi:hypothetical protein OC834_002556 [Tilletia horrida]|uniref:PEBP-like protein n=1 Tax=Tilletia horrida TaxID=155126 RepID=A0AAN6GCF2_9BASI|nr:hypothetical protein OC842_005347 [Tilletia horrida]KAK0532583.1 hypothetical protein OC834_002556 [Tilletia horrida]KAK0536861.1 hypothetical protein OC835_001906 [Tilletia horrida]KAK0553711.1 hypothetical protein OC844_006263 [Tilletia horrida]
MRSFTALASLLTLAASSRAAFDAPVDATAQAVADAVVSFQAQNLVPNPIPADELQPLAALTVSYPQAGVVGVGQRVPQAQVQSQPTWTLNVTAGQAASFKGKLFTLIVADPGAPSNNYNGLVVRHCLGNNFTVSDQGELKNTSALVTRYFGPAPPAGSGPHRYMHLVLAQPADFRPPADLSQPNTPLVTDWNLTQYFEQANLGPIVAASFMVVQEGATNATTVTAVPTPDAASISATAAALETKFSGTASATSAPSGSATNKTGAAGPSAAADIRGWAALLGVTAGAVLTGAVSLLL